MIKTQNQLLYKKIIRAALQQLLILTAFMSMAFSQNRDDRSWYPPDNTGIEKFKQSVEPLMKMSIGEVIAEVPSASGFLFIDCPNCHGGSQGSGVLSWKPGMGDQVRCNFCQMIFPNEKFPHNREKVIIAPSGARQVYRYHEDSRGWQYFYEGHAWYDRWLWMQTMAGHLAKVWYATKDNAYGDRAAAIAGRFAQVFPDYAVRYDFPYTAKKFFPANQKWPYEGIPNFRGAKWSWWAYMDIPLPFANVYDILKSGYDWKRMDKFIGQETDKRIVNDLLRLAYEFTMANPVSYHNMEPGMYRDMIRLGRVLEDPTMVNQAVKHFRELLSRGFFADGWWKEGASSYHDMTINGLNIVVDALKGYTYPANWKGERLDNLDLKEIYLYKKAIQVKGEAILPNGRKIPINDTWAFRGGQEAKTARTVSRLWPSLGNAALGTGEGENQIMLNVNWSGNYGHSHADNGSIILYAMGQELLSDIGYSHTKYHGWTVQTPSHNTVVIDQKEQDRGTLVKPVTGNLKLYDDKDTHVKVIDVDASPAYAVAKTYRRRLVMVNIAPGQDYIIDRFDAEGGRDHDWLLHGMLEQEGTLETSMTLSPLAGTLAPEWGGKEPPKGESDIDPMRFNHPYTYLRDIKNGNAAGKPWTATWRYDGGVGLRTHNLSSEGMKIYSFRAPSVRTAGEDDLKLEDFKHNGIMLRNSGKASTFLAVHEPFRNQPWIESVKKDGDALLVRYKLNGKAIVDRILIKEDQITVNSSAGWKYNSGTPRSGKVAGLQTAGGKYRLELDNEAPKVNYIRLDLADGGTRYYPVSLVQGKVLELPDDPGFTMGADGKVIFHTFPKEQYSGPLRYTLFAK